MLTERIDNYILENYGSDGAAAFSDLRLHALSIDRYKKIVKYTVSSPTEYTQSQKDELLKILQAISVKGFKTMLDMVADRMDCDVAKRLLWEYMKENCPSVYLALSDSRDCVEYKDDSGTISITFNVSKKVKELLSNGSLDGIKRYFGSITSIPVIFHVNEVDGEVSDPQEVFEELSIQRKRTVDAYSSKPIRRIALEEKRDLIGKIRNEFLPRYIIDVLPSEQSVLVCGKVGNINKHESKNKDITICKFSLTDFSGTINVVLFARDEKTLNAFCSVYDGDEVVVRGKPNLNTYSNKLEIMANAIARCKVARQVAQLDEFKPLPPEYALVGPMPFEKGIQANAFSDENSTLSVLKGKSFVVFDVETTGTQYQLEKITEIGAVKIVDGKMTETFNTLINPQIAIPKDISEMTHITDEMVKDKPIFAEICGDFYKFCYGCTIVGHNIAFDYSFIDFNARPCGFLFNNPQVDTIAMAKKYFHGKSAKNKPKDNKLETLVKFFNLEYGEYHRAEYDSIMTAMLFLKLIGLDETLLEKNN